VQLDAENKQIPTLKAQLLNLKNAIVQLESQATE
jgi:hypothetical protein